MIGEAYLPRSPEALLGAVAALLGAAVAGFVAGRLRSVGLARILAGASVLFGATGMHVGLTGEGAGFRMLAIIGVTLYAMKGVVAVESRRLGMTPLPIGAWLGFVLTWFGMRPRIFAERRSVPRPRSGELLRRGLARLGAGLALVLIARWTWAATGSRLLATLLVLPGLSLVLHFGLFNLAAAAWRRLGVDARALFRAPQLSASLEEFWGRRWNVGFSEMTSLAVFRPLRGVVGKRPAITLAFLFSGALHELAISVPVGAGYGLPFAYFLLHALAMRVERPLTAGGWLRGAAARAWTIGWLVLPAPILFHRPFLEGVVWPLLGSR